MSKPNNFAAVVRIISLMVLSGISARSDQTPTSEIIVRNADGYFAIRNLSLTPNDYGEKLDSKAYNGLSHDWSTPEFTVYLEGHDDRDESKHVQHSLLVTLFCDWFQRRECTLASHFAIPAEDFKHFVIEKYDFVLTGGHQSPNLQISRR